ncbi:MAG: 1-deoxy-D-xylulose-5-phosphate reductoisomerase [Vallitaleaceae bacterium]|nr:1-deoxy-D-xylulose-5-phosphate reductoisomerase [Vallitaleaceae bacterium]
MKKIAILGSTGSIGRQTLEVVLEQRDIEVCGLTTNTNIDLLEEQINIYNPSLVAVMDRQQAAKLRTRIVGSITVLEGMEGLIKVATMAQVDMVVTAVVGMIGLRPTIEAIKAGKDIALANKETLVTAGELIMKLVKAYQVRLVPVDSEHSAIMQSLEGESHLAIESILLTASGGPFRTWDTEAMKKVTLADALKHPNWSMGKKITIDSATLMNKGLEVIEAKWLFDVKMADIKVIIHPQSIIHSMVQYIDGSVIGQMGLPDMKLPIQYALYYPERKYNQYKRLKLSDIQTLTFEEPCHNNFPCLNYAYEAMTIGGTMPTVLNAANEKAVCLFLSGQIEFLDIPKLIEYAMSKHDVKEADTLEIILETEKWAHETIDSYIKSSK